MYDFHTRISLQYQEDAGGKLQNGMSLLQRRCV